MFKRNGKRLLGIIFMLTRFVSYKLKKLFELSIAFLNGPYENTPKPQTYMN